MAGHSKWANTKHRKAAQDIKKSKIFTKIIRKAMIAAKTGGENPNTNTQLKTAIDEALSNNIPRNIIQRIIQKHVNMKNSKLQSIKYGGYGSSGAAIILECHSNNKNRIVSEIRHTFSKFNYHLTTLSSIEYFFQKKILIHYQYNTNKKIIEQIFYKHNIEAVIKTEDSSLQVIIDPKYFKIIKSTLSDLDIIPQKIIFLMMPVLKIELNKNEKTLLTNLMIELQSNTDIKKIYHNVDLLHNK